MRVLFMALFLFFTVLDGFPRGGNELVDPAFRLSNKNLESAVAGVSASIRANIIARPKEFLHLMASVLSEPQDLLILVDKANGLPRDGIPGDLVYLSGYRLNLIKDSLRLRRVLIDDLLAMVQAAGKEGVTLPISSTFRSYDAQVILFENELKTKSREEVEKELAPPGHSQHQLGTVIDFGSIDLSFANTPAGKWLFLHAGEFGFSLSYPKDRDAETGYTYEPWHYRFVGRSAAALISGFFGESQQAFLVFYKEMSGYFRNAWKDSPAGGA
jgi:D-alanyl-D-alanine carboxypeptidase